MAEMVLKLSRDPASGKPVVVVELHSDADSLPFEHEETHRKVIETLVGKGLISQGEDPTLVITRLDKKGQPLPESGEAPQTPEPARQAGGR
ncbi:MAG: hypothetical protein LW700_06115 [Gemmataceae bacterium]|jgi:hypothetical protein|nr:hypothetical protein [Gemmataceae bacterium]